MGKLFRSTFFLLFTVGLLCFSNQNTYATCVKLTYKVKSHDILSKIVLRQKHKLHLHAHLYGANGLLDLTLKENPEIKQPGNLIYSGTKVTFPMELSVPKNEIEGCGEAVPLARTVKHGKHKRHIASVLSEPPQIMPSPTPQPSPTVKPISVPSPEPTLTSVATPAPTSAPTPEPSLSPVPQPSPEPSSAPTAEPTAMPSVTATEVPSPAPENDSKPQETPKSEILASKADVDIGLGAMVVDTAASLSFPQFYLKSQIPLSKKLVLLPMVDGFMPTYTNATANTLELEARIAAGYKLLNDNLTLGLGARYFSFGYNSPSSGAGTAASSLDVVALASYLFKMNETMSLEALASFWLPMTISGASADAVTSSFQFGGFGLLLKGGYTLNPTLSIGPYLYFSNLSLNWTENGSTPDSLSSTEFGLGANLNIKF